MAQVFRIASATALDAGMDRLRTEAVEEGFHFVERLVRDWTSDSNTFEQPGERFLGAFSESDLIGMCGINRDPYAEGNADGRLRHLYVRRRARRRGIGSALVQRLLNEAQPSSKACAFALTRRKQRPSTFGTASCL